MAKYWREEELGSGKKEQKRKGTRDCMWVCALLSLLCVETHHIQPIYPSKCPYGVKVVRFRLDWVPSRVHIGFGKGKASQCAPFVRESISLVVPRLPVGMPIDENRGHM